MMGVIALNHAAIALGHQGLVTVAANVHQAYAAAECVEAVHPVAQHNGPVAEIGKYISMQIVLYITPSIAAMAVLEETAIHRLAPRTAQAKYAETMAAEEAVELVHRVGHAKVIMQLIIMEHAPVALAQYLFQLIATLIMVGIAQDYAQKSIEIIPAQERAAAAVIQQPAQEIRLMEQVAEQDKYAHPVLV